MGNPHQSILLGHIHQQPVAAACNADYVAIYYNAVAKGAAQLAQQPTPEAGVLCGGKIDSIEVQNSTVCN